MGFMKKINEELVILGFGSGIIGQKIFTEAFKKKKIEALQWCLQTSHCVGLSNPEHQARLQPWSEWSCLTRFTHDWLHLSEELCCCCLWAWLALFATGSDDSCISSCKCVLSLFKIVLYFLYFLRVVPCLGNFRGLWFPLSSYFSPTSVTGADLSFPHAVIGLVPLCNF